MVEINKTLETKYKESQQPKVKIQSARGGIASDDKNDVASILNEIKDIIIEIKDKLFDKKRAGVAPSGKKQLDPSSNVKEVMNRNKVAEVEAEQASADAQKRAENIDKQNALNYVSNFFYYFKKMRSISIYNWALNLPD
jgi:hypothetical protein